MNESVWDEIYFKQSLKHSIKIENFILIKVSRTTGIHTVRLDFLILPHCLNKKKNENLF